MPGTELHSELHLLGVTDGHIARLVSAKLTLADEGARGVLAPSVTRAQGTAAAFFGALGLADLEEKTRASTFVVTVSDDAASVSGRSGELSIAAAVVAIISGTMESTADLVASARLDEGGGLGVVQGTAAKAQAATQAGKKLLVAREQPVEGSKSLRVPAIATSLTEAQMALLILGGTQLLVRLLDEGRDLGVSWTLHQVRTVALIHAHVQRFPTGMGALGRSLDLDRLDSHQLFSYFSSVGLMARAGDLIGPDHQDVVSAMGWDTGGDQGVADALGAFIRTSRQIGQREELSEAVKAAAAMVTSARFALGKKVMGPSQPVGGVIASLGTARFDQELRERLESLIEAAQAFAPNPSPKPAMPLSTPPELVVTPNYDGDQLVTCSYELPVRHPVDGEAWIGSPTTLFDERLSGLNPPFAEAVRKAVAAGVVAIDIRPVPQVRAVRILWRNGKRVWPPSIDALWAASDLAKVLDGRSDIHTIADIGTGTGVLGLLALRLGGKRVQRLWFVDQEPQARQYTARNLVENFTCTDRRGRELHGVLPFSTSGLTQVRVQNGHGEGDVEVAYVEATGDSFVTTDAFSEPDARLDLALMAPPYAPVDGIELPEELWGAVAGTKLLGQVVEHAGKVTRQLFLQIGEIAMPDFERALARARAHGDVTVELIGRRVVGFRIPGLIDLLKHLSWRKRLLDGCLRRVQSRDEAERFQHWLTSSGTPPEFREFLVGYLESGGDPHLLPLYWHTVGSWLLTYAEPTKA